MMKKCSTRALTVVLAVWSVTASAGNPVLSGLYRVGSLGLIDFSSASGGELVGRYKGKGACDFESEMRVVSGRFEGNVFVGQVLLCQEGPGCAPVQTYPLLGFFADHKLVTMVKFEAGCGSKATDHRQLTFKEAESDDRASLGSASAAQIASRNKSKMEQAAEAVKQGQVRLQGNKFRAAEQQFQVALAYDDTSAEAWLGLGASQIRLAQLQSAVSSLYKAMERTRSNTTLGAQVQYNLGCAYSLMGKKREGMKALREAIHLGGSEIAENLDSDSDLENLRSEKDFASLKGSGKR